MLAAGVARADDPHSNTATATERSLRGRFGGARALKRLSAPSERERLSGIARLGGLGSSWAIERLTELAVERERPLTAREWLGLARALWPHAGLPASQRLLVKIMGQLDDPAQGPQAAALTRLARYAAGLALADDGSESALRLLGRAVRAGGPTASVAAAALVAHPPSRLEPLVAGLGEPSVELARLLGDLGDQRAFGALRQWVRSESAEVRAAAAIALTRLGHLETVPLALEWRLHDVEALRVGALEILLLAGHPQGAEDLARQLGEPQPRERLKALALAHPVAALGPVAVERAVASPDQGWWLTLLGRIGGAEAAAPLLSALDGPSGVVAAHALSRLDGRLGHDAVQAALDQGVAPALSVRVAALRSWERGEHFEGLEAVVARLASTQAPAERAAAAWVRALGGGAPAALELTSGDPVRTAAAAQHVLLLDDGPLKRAVETFSESPAGPVRTALGAALCRSGARRLLSGDQLLELVDTDEALRPLALRALAARGERRARPLVYGYLNTPVVDWQILHQLSVVPGLLERLRTTFLTSGHDEICEMHELAAAGDRTRLQAAAHRLKGAALTLGAMRLGEELLGVEDAAAAAPDTVVARLAAVDASFAELREALLATEHV
jgi:HPt (histidine-containing phosphotransfer) domain-containing protein